jgi:phage gpG-like protein
MLEIRGTLEGDKELSRRFKALPEEIGDMKAPFGRINREMKVAIQSNYGSRGATFGERWAPRKDSKPHPLLEKTGQMRASFTHRLGPAYLEISNSAKQFKFHQSNRPRTKLPRRVMLKIDQIRKTFIVKELQRHLHKTVTGK